MRDGISKIMEDSSFRFITLDESKYIVLGQRDFNSQRGVFIETVNSFERRISPNEVRRLFCDIIGYLPACNGLKLFLHASINDGKINGYASQISGENTIHLAIENHKRYSDLVYTILHELTHIRDMTVGHDESFMENFRALICLYTHIWEVRTYFYQSGSRETITPHTFSDLSASRFASFVN